MYGDNDKLKLFRSECRKYKKYLEIIQNLEIKKEELIVEMHNIKSPVTDRIGSNPNKVKEGNRMLELMEKKTFLEKKISLYKDAVNWINTALDDIPYSAYRPLIWATCIDYERMADFSDKYGISVGILNKNKKTCILRIMTKERVLKYERIQKELEDIA